MKKTLEYKIRVPEVESWEETPVYTSVELSGTKEEIENDAVEIAEGIAISQHSKVRWNYAGQLQGHYVEEIFPDGAYSIVEERIRLIPEVV